MVTSLKPMKRRKLKKRVHLTNKDKIQVYDANYLRNFSESSGTDSYGPPRSTRTFYRLIDKANLIRSEPTRIYKAENLPSEFNTKIAPVNYKKYNEPSFSHILKSHEQPKFGEFERETLQSTYARQQEMIKETVADSLNEFFSGLANDIVLTINITQASKRSILDVELTKNLERAKCNSATQHLRQKPSQSVCFTSKTSTTSSADATVQRAVGTVNVSIMGQLFALCNWIIGLWSK